MSFEVQVAGEKVGVVYDTNPSHFQSEAECRDFLHRILELVEESDRDLFRDCLKVLDARVDDACDFGFQHIWALSQMAQKYHEYATFILATSQFLTESVDFEGEMDDDSTIKFLDLAIRSYSALGDVLNNSKC